MSLTVAEVKKIVSRHSLNDISECDSFRAVTAEEMKSPCSNHIDLAFMKRLDDGFHIELGLKHHNIYK